MSRKIDRLVVVEGQFGCITPLHVGGLESASRSDLALCVNGDGQFYLPGTGLAGPMRAWCAEMWGETAAKEVWGHQEQKKPNEGWASFVTVEDAVMGEKAVSPEIRDGVGINRYAGTAADQSKFDREILPAGTELPFCLIYDEQPGETLGAQMLASLLLALQEGELRFGASKSRGLGKVELTKTRTTEHILNTRPGILSLLRGEPSPINGLEALCKDWKQQRRIRPLVKIYVGWRPIGPLMVKAGVDGAVVDTLPLVSQNKKESRRLVLPGSSSKGAMRAHAERIMSTLFDNGSSMKDIGFLEQITAHPLVETLFGARNADEHDNEQDGEQEDEDDNNKCEALLGLSALSVDDCFSKTELSCETWQHMLGQAPERDGQQDQAAAADAEDEDELLNWTKSLPQLKRNQDGEPYLDPAMHVAIDRWTGGAANEALFSVLEPWNFKWGRLDLTLDLNRLARHRTKDSGKKREDVALAAVTLLVAVLDDFVRGELPLGFAVNRGFGAVECEGIAVMVPKLEDYHSEHVRGLLAKLEKLVARVENGKLIIEGAEAPAKAWRDYLSTYELNGEGVAT